MTKVFIYCRVSSAGQVSGDGFPRQIETCKRFADSKGWVVARIFQESQTGSDEWSDRKLLSEAMDLAGGVMDIKTIVVERADRLSRDLIVGELFLRECKKRGIQVFAADSGEELVNATGDPTKVLIRQILGALSQWEKSIIVRKLAAGRKAKAEKTGKPCGGSSPDRYGDRGGVAQQNLEKRVIGTILYWSKEGSNFSQIARDLTRRRIQIPHPNFVHRKGQPQRTPFFWTRELVRGLFNDWVNTMSILPFIKDNL